MYVLYNTLDARNKKSKNLKCHNRTTTNLITFSFLSAIEKLNFMVNNE